jgi:hypothetical protein
LRAAAAGRSFGGAMTAKRLNLSPFTGMDAIARPGG